MIGRAILSVSLVVTLAACASSRPAPIVAGGIRPGPVVTRPPITPAPVTPAVPVPSDFTLTPVAFDSVPGWATADMAPALQAFKRQCDSWRLRTPDAPLSGGRYGGRVSDWFNACNAALTAQPGQERWFFEAYFDPQYVAWRTGLDTFGPDAGSQARQLIAEAHGCCFRWMLGPDRIEQGRVFDDRAGVQAQHGQYAPLTLRG